MKRYRRIEMMPYVPGEEAFSTSFPRPGAFAFPFRHVLRWP